MDTKSTAILIVIAVGILGGMYGFFALRRLVRRWLFGAGKVDIRRQWADVESLIARNEAMSARLAVLHADAVFDKALQLRHFPGDRFATRLQFARRKYTSLRKVWWAHKLRNDLAHEPDRVMKMSEARSAVAALRKALKDLGAL